MAEIAPLEQVVRTVEGGGKRTGLALQTLACGHDTYATTKRERQAKRRRCLWCGTWCKGCGRYETDQGQRICEGCHAYQDHLT